MVLLNGPYWFMSLDSLFNLVYVLITLLIGGLSYKAYKLTEERKYKYFAVAFGLMSIAFFVYFTSTILLTTHISSNVTSILTGFDYAFLVYVFFTMMAYALLFITTLKIEDHKIRTLILTLMFTLTVVAYQYYLKFHIAMFAVLFLLTYNFYDNYLEKKNFNAKLVFISFFLLTCAQLFYLAEIYNGLFYVVAVIMQLVGFLVLFYMLLRILNNGREKRKA
ncbi:hypothetical protein J4223_02430 [Candidatus Woesearchaeota archaeon]|nr:hypothetical protein [Candidatus Woesearchaeota archaeon]